MAWQLRRIIAENLWEMGMNVVPGINKWIALTVQGTLRFFLIGMVQLGIHGLFAYVTCGKRIGDNLFSFTMGGALVFLRCYCTRIWLKKTNGGVWGGGNGEERENGERVLERKKEFVFGLQRDSLLNTQVINAGMKGDNGSTIRKRMKLMKQQMCFKIIAKLGNSKKQHCSWQKNLYLNIYIYIYMCVCVCKVGTTVQKAREGKEDGKIERVGKSFIHIWIAGTLHMFRGLNVDGHFGSPSGTKKPSNTDKKELVNR